MDARMEVIMATTKLTLSIPIEMVVKARKLAKHRRTSISALFSNYIAAQDTLREGIHVDSLPPLTKRALELAKDIPPVPADWDYREELTDALMEKYDIK